jgi:hypothetical protein
MNIHLRILGWLYSVMGIVSLIATGYFTYALYGAGPGGFSPEVQRILIDAGYGTLLLWLLAFASLGTLLTGWALLRMHRFARTLAYVFAVLGLIDFPLGTMLGVYTIWALRQTKPEQSPEPSALA